MGTLKCFDQRFGKLGFHPTPPVNLSMPEFGVETLPTITFLEQGKPSSLAGGESFTVFVDSQGAIRALLGGYKVLSEVEGEFKTIVSNFLVNYWKQLGGGDPSFSYRPIAVSLEYPDGRQQIAIMSKGPVQGQWTKGTSVGHILIYVKKVSPTAHLSLSSDKMGSQKIN